MTVRSGFPAVRRKSETLAKRSGQLSTLRRCCRIRCRIRRRRRRSDGGMRGSGRPCMSGAVRNVSSSSRRGPGSSAYGRSHSKDASDMPQLLHLAGKGSFVYGRAVELLHPDKHPGKGSSAYGRSHSKDASDMPHPTTTACALSTSLRARCVEAGIEAGFADECVDIEAGIADERAMPITPTSKTRDSP